MAKSLLAQLALGGAAVAAIVVTSTTVQPVYVGRAPAVQRLVAEAGRDAAVEGPVRIRGESSGEVAEVAIGSEQFEADRRAFASDLVSTGRVTAARADSLAAFAVREAYIQRVPPALVFGVLLTENATFKSAARSNVGAVGLMQIYPKYWVPTLGKKFGRDLRNDETNLRYGVHILAHYVYSSVSRVADPTADAVVSKGLLRYNGCVRGTNTRGCHSYPDKVRRAVDRFAVAQCGAAGYDGCVERPLERSLAAGPLRVASAE